MKTTLSAFAVAVAGACMLTACEGPDLPEAGAAHLSMTKPEDATSPATKTAAFFYINEMPALVTHTDGTEFVVGAGCVITDREIAPDDDKEVNVRVIHEKDPSKEIKGAIPATNLNPAYWLKSAKECTNDFVAAADLPASAPASGPSKPAPQRFHLRPRDLGAA